MERRLDQIAELMERIMRSMHRLIRVESARWDLTPHQYVLLRELEGAGPMHVGALRRAAPGAQSTRSEMVARLARAGYVRKRIDREDKRAVVVEITPRGREAVARRRRELRERNRRILAALGPEDQARFVEAFETLAALTDRAALAMEEVEDERS